MRSRSVVGISILLVGSGAGASALLKANQLALPRPSQSPRRRGSYRVENVLIRFKATSRLPAFRPRSALPHLSVAEAQLLTKIGVTDD
jgi:hypothetical protein